MKFNIELLNKDQAIGCKAAQQLKPLYRIAYADAPYNYGDADAEEFFERFSSQIQQEGFRLLLGRVGKQLAGFAYGYVFPDNVWWRGALEEPPPELITASKYAVIELVIHPDFRGHGFSRRLLDRLIEGREEHMAILLAKPGAVAHEMYQRWGWTKVGEVQSYAQWPVDDSFIFSLNPTHDTRCATTVATSSGQE